MTHRGIRSPCAPVTGPVVRLHPEHARFVDAVHQLGDVLITHIPRTPPSLETFGRPVWLFREQFAASFRALLACDRAGRKSRYSGHTNKQIVGPGPAWSTRVRAVVAVQIEIEGQRRVIPSGSGVGVKRVCLFAKATPRCHSSRDRRPCTREWPGSRRHRGQAPSPLALPARTDRAAR